MKRPLWFVEANDENNRIYRSGPYETKDLAAAAAAFWIDDGSTLVSLRQMRRGVDGIWEDARRK